MSIRLIAKIELLEGQGAIINNAGMNISNNNISLPVNEVLGVRRIGSNPFILGGASKLDSGAFFSNRENYYIGNQISDENGDFENRYVMGILGTGLTNFSILFDTFNNAYPTGVFVNGESKPNDNDPNWNFGNLEDLGMHTVMISGWSLPKHPLRIQGLFTGLTIDVNERNLIEMIHTRNDRVSSETANYGIISNVGIVKFLDFDTEVQDYIKEKLLKKKLSVKMYVENTLFRDKFMNTGKISDHSKMQLVADLVTDRWDYNAANFEVKVDCKEDLEEWQKNLVPNLFLFSNKTAMDLLNDLRSYTPTKFIFEDLDIETTTRLNEIKIKYYYFKSGNLWESYNKLCQIALLHIYKNALGNVVVQYNGGN